MMASNICCASRGNRTSSEGHPKWQLLVGNSFMVSTCGSKGFFFKKRTFNSDPTLNLKATLQLLTAAKKM